MQTVLLEITSGPQANQRIWIRLGQIIRLGSAEHADVVIDSDRTLAALHVSVGHSRAGCFVECLEHTDNITVNGKAVQRSRLHHGDIVVAGETEFQAFVTNDASAGNDRSADTESMSTQQANPGMPPRSESPPEVAESASTAEDQPTIANERVEIRQLDYHASQLSDASWQLSAETTERNSLDGIIRSLAVNKRCFVCGGFPKPATAGNHPKENSSHRQLDDQVAIQQLSCDEAVKLFASPATSQSALLLFSSQSIDLVSQSVSSQLFSFRRPGIFATQICVATPGIVRKMFRQMVAVLIVTESQHWQVFTSLDVDQSWRELGLPNPPVQRGQ